MIADEQRECRKARPYVCTAVLLILAKLTDEAPVMEISHLAKALPFSLLRKGLDFADVGRSAVDRPGQPWLPGRGLEKAQTGGQQYPLAFGHGCLPGLKRPGALRHSQMYALDNQ